MESHVYGAPLSRAARRTLTAMGGATEAVGLFTVLLSRRFPKSPDVSIRITPTGAGISHTFLWRDVRPIEDEP